MMQPKTRLCVFAFQQMVEQFNLLSIHMKGKYRLWFLFSVCINIVHPGLKQMADFFGSAHHIHCQKLFETM